jgi:hypothetical protein
VLTPDQEAIIVAFLRPTRLTPEDCLSSLQASIPYFSRSSLQRCLQRHDISRISSLTNCPAGDGIGGSRTQVSTTGKIRNVFDNHASHALGARQMP